MDRNSDFAGTVKIARVVGVEGIMGVLLKYEFGLV